MPAKSERQRKLMGAALSCKRDKTKCKGEIIKKVAKGMTKKQLREFASKKK